MNSKYMEMAISEARLAFDEDEVPVGAVIVKNGEVLAKAHNLKEHKGAAIYHAEILAIVMATEKIKNWRLDDCDIYITLEPCPMCASAIKQSRVRNVYCGLSNSDSNNLCIIEKIFESDSINNSVNFFSDLAVDEVRNLMQKFFSEKRKK